MGRTCIILSQPILKGSAVYSIKHWIILSHNWRCYQPVLRINKIVQAERKGEQLQQKERTAYEISKSRGKKYKIINLTVSKTIGDYKLKRLQNKLPPFTVNPIKTEFTDVLGVLKSEKVISMTQTNNETLGSMDGRIRGQAQTSPTTNTTTSEINVVRRSNKSLHPKKKNGVNVRAGSQVVKKTERIINERTVENDDYNLNLEANALHEAVNFQMMNGRPPTLEDLRMFLTSGEIDMIWDDLDYLFGKGWDKPTETATIPRGN